MATTLKLLSNAAFANKENNGGGNVSSGGGGSTGSSRRKKPWKKSQCIGGYCWSHGYHPCDHNHTSTTCTFKKDGQKSGTSFNNNLGGNDYWPPVHCVIECQKTHLTFAGKFKPTTWNGPGHDKADIDWEKSQAIALNLKQNLLSNFYSILSDNAPPTCQVEEQDDNHNETVYNTNKLKEGVWNGSIPSTFADSAATSGIRTKKDQSRNAFVLTGQQSDKAFLYAKQSSGGSNCNGWTPPSTTTASKRCAHRTSNWMRLADQHTQVHWCKLYCNFWQGQGEHLQHKQYKNHSHESRHPPRLALQPNKAVAHSTRKTCTKQQYQHSPLQPPANGAPSQATPPNQGYCKCLELKAQPELVRYYHAAVGFPTKPIWVAAIKNRQFAYGRASQQKQSPSISWSQERLLKDMATRHEAASAPQRLQPVTGKPSTCQWKKPLVRGYLNVLRWLFAIYRFAGLLYACLYSKFSTPLQLAFPWFVHLVWPCVACWLLASARSLTQVKNSDLMFAWWAGGWCLVK